MTNQQILAIAMAQSATDCNCNADDFFKEENIIVQSEENKLARKYLELPFSCQLVSYGSNIVASVQEEYREVVQHYLEKYPVEHCFETPNLHVLNEELLPYGQKICFMAEYFLPDVDKLEEKPCAYDKGKLIGLAACSADCHDMWQIGIDVLPEYRRQGVATALTSRLALEILKHGKVPFYCAA